MATDEEDVAELTGTIKQLFKEWDSDGNGCISREELQAVIWKLGPFTSQEIDLLLAEADVDGNGFISYDEFVGFIMTPGSRVQIEAKAPVLFDLKAAFRPLFEVYDIDKNGRIGKSEFKQCHEILCAALEDLPDDHFCWESEGSTRPDLLRSATDKTFEEVDRDNTKSLSLIEFAEFQRNALEFSGLIGHHMEDFVKQLAETMQQVLDLKRGCGRSVTEGLNSSKADALFDNLSHCAAKFWKGEGCPKPWAKFVRGSRAGYSNVWERPPREMSIKNLLKQHMKVVGVPTKSAKGVKVQVQMVVPDSKAESPRRWIAKVVQTTTLHGMADTPAVSNSKSSYYGCDDDPDIWSVLPSSAWSAYNDSVANLAPELRLLALLYREANFGDTVSWGGVRYALADAVEMGLLSSEQQQSYDDDVSKVFHKTMLDNLDYDEELDDLCPICFEDLQYSGGFEKHLDKDVHQKRVHELSFELEFQVLGVMTELSERDIIPCCTSLTSCGRASVASRSKSKTSITSE